MFIQKNDIQYINSVTHEGKVIILATSTEGQIFYTIKQDGFEDSYLNTPAEQRTGWENWQQLELPDEDDDISVVNKEKKELTYQNEASRYVFKSCYKTQNRTFAAPVQAISAFDHLYIFRQSDTNTLLVDRFVVDGMTNTLNRKLDVRFKRSRQKHTPTKSMAKENHGLTNIDTLDFRDANNQFFYEPTIEIHAVSHLYQGWFSVVVVPTIEHNVHRWHIFAYNSGTHKVELTTLRVSKEGLFEAKDYTIFELLEGIIVPHQIPGVIKRTLDINATITNGPTATKYDIQQAQLTQSGQNQLLKIDTRVMLTIPTDKGAAALSFSIAKDGTLAQIDEKPTQTTIRSDQKEILLPLNTLDEIRAFGDTTPTPQGVIQGLSVGTQDEDVEDLVKVLTGNKAADLETGDEVKISGNSSYQGLYQVKRVNNDTFDVDIPAAEGLGYWEKKEQKESGLIFDGMITAYARTADGKLQVTCKNHGLANGDQVQILATESYNDTYPIQKIDDTTFVINHQWPEGEVVNVQLASQKRRGMVLDGTSDYIEVPFSPTLNTKTFTIEGWVKPQAGRNYRAVITSRDSLRTIQGYIIYITPNNKWSLWIGHGGDWQTIDGPTIQAGVWTHLAGTYDGQTLKFFINGAEVGSQNSTYIPNIKQPLRIGAGATESDPNYFFPGQIADVRYWDIPRTADHIKNSMYLQLRGKELGLAGYWRLGGLSEGRVLDFSTNENDGQVHGTPYISAKTLKRTIGDGSTAVKYSNDELFAVSERATYKESFEFKVNSKTAINLAYLNNADGHGTGNRIFTLSYWGKTSRTAEKRIPITIVKQHDIEKVDNEWYRISADVTIPDKVSLLRSFEITDIHGAWQTIEIRKHHFHLQHDSITQSQHNDKISLTTLANSQVKVKRDLHELAKKEQLEVSLLQELRRLQQRLEALKNLEQTRQQVSRLHAEIASHEKELAKYEAIIRNPFNYWCFIYSNRISRHVGTSKEAISKHWSFEEIAGVYHIVHRESNSLLEDGTHETFLRLQSEAAQIRRDLPTLYSYVKNFWEWRLQNTAQNRYRIVNSATHGDFAGIGLPSYSPSETEYLPILDYSITSTGQPISESYIKETNKKITSIQKTLKEKRANADRLEETLRQGDKNKKAWENRLAEVMKQIEQVQIAINRLNAQLLRNLRQVKQTAQQMSPIAKDQQGLMTQGALLGFVQPASRLHTTETSEGNVQLSYFDTQGRVRQTNYDATADDKNALFEQWEPEAQRACLNLNQSNSYIELKKHIFLRKSWSVELWFVYPLPEKPGIWSSFIRGDNYDTQIMIKDGNRLGTYWGGSDQHFYDSGFNLDLLQAGWHHLAAVGQADTVTFYIDGEKVGDLKEKVIADAQAELDKDPDSEQAEQELQKAKKLDLNKTSIIKSIGNRIKGGQQVGKLAEVRIWNTALTKNEIAINSNTLLTGNEPDLLAYYPLNEAIGKIAKDGTKRGNNGNIVGENWWICTAPIGNPGHHAMQFDGRNDYIELSKPLPIFSSSFTISMWIKIDYSADRMVLLGDYKLPNSIDVDFSITSDGRLRFYWNNQPNLYGKTNLKDNQWHFVSFVRDKENSHVYLYVDGSLDNQYVGAIPDKIAHTGHRIGADSRLKETCFAGQIANLQIWSKAQSAAEIRTMMYQWLTGHETDLAAYYRLDHINHERGENQTLDLAGNNHGIVHDAIIIQTNTLPLNHGQLCSGEYSTISIDKTTNQKIAMMRRYLAYPTGNGITMFYDKRVEQLELKWIGNAQFAPTLLGYIEGAPPVPSENLTINEDYNGATSVELTMSEDIAFNWNRAQDAGLGGTIDAYFGIGGKTSILVAPMGIGTSVGIEGKAVHKGDFDFNYQFLNESSITSSSALNMTDKLALRGTSETTPHFPHLGKRFIPKNIGYALVVSSLADVFVMRLARSGTMTGYQVRPVEGIPPDVNTITFLMNPAYTMNGSLDGLTGSAATSNRFFRHVPDMRSQYGSLYPASYYRLKEAYDLKQAIEAEDKRRESYFSNFNVRLVDETSLDRNIDSGPSPSRINLQREEDQQDGTPETNEQIAQVQNEKVEAFQNSTTAQAKETGAKAKARHAEIQSKIKDQDQRVQATESFASWQKRMEDIQIRAGKRNIVNTYVWDADGGLRIEAQSFANTVEHTIGGSFNMNAGYGFEGDFVGGQIAAALTAQATINLTQTMCKTESRSKGFELNVNLDGLEHRGITNYDDKPLMPGEKVDRYRFMSFYLEGSTDNFQDFFNYVVDPEWLRSNDEEARALRQTQAGKPNKTWRVLHRVTYVERPALMGFGQDVRKTRALKEKEIKKTLYYKVTQLEKANKELAKKLDKILSKLS